MISLIEFPDRIVFQEKDEEVIDLISLALTSVSLVVAPESSTAARQSTDIDISNLTDPTSDSSTDILYSIVFGRKGVEVMDCPTTSY